MSRRTKATADRQPTFEARITQSLEQLRRFPISDATWQLGIVRAPVWAESDDLEPFRPPVALCAPSTGHAYGFGGFVLAAEAPLASALEAIAMMAGRTSWQLLPRAIEVRDVDLARTLDEQLAGLDIEVRLADELSGLESARERFVVDYADPDERDSSIADGVSLERMHAFASAAVAFHHAAPWNALSPDDVLVVESPSAPVGMAYASVFGDADSPRGLQFHASREAFEDWADGDQGDAELPETLTWAVWFDDIVDLSIPDAERVEAHGLPCVNGTEHPQLLGLGPGGAVTPASAEHLAFAEALLLAISASGEDELDSGRWTRAVRTSDGVRNVTLALPDVLECTHAPESGTPMAMARELVVLADNHGGRSRCKFARAALRLWPDCADGHLVLAEATPDLAPRAEHYRLAMAAAERTFPPGAFEKWRGRFWDGAGARPYVFARSALASTLWDMGESDAAVAHWHILIALDAADHLGVRHVLAPRLIELDRDEDAAEVIAAFAGDDSALLAYPRALIEFRRRGASETAQQALQGALRSNARAPLYLTGRLRLPELEPEFHDRGSDAEAQVVASLILAVWNATEGATAWLNAAIRPPKSERRMQRRKRP